MVLKLKEKIMSQRKWNQTSSIFDPKKESNQNSLIGKQMKMKVGPKLQKPNR